MNKRNLHEMADFLIKIDYRKSPFYKDLPKMPIRTAGYTLEQYLAVWRGHYLYLEEIFSFLGINNTINDISKYKGILRKYKDSHILVEDIWQWCFSPEWEKLAQTMGESKLRRGKPNKKLKDAVILTLAERETGQRILWLLDFGLPKNWKDQMEGKEDRDCVGRYGLKDFARKPIIAADKPAHTDNL